MDKRSQHRLSNDSNCGSNVTGVRSRLGMVEGMGRRDEEWFDDVTRRVQGDLPGELLTLRRT